MTGSYRIFAGATMSYLRKAGTSTDLLGGPFFLNFMVERSQIMVAQYYAHY